VESDSNTEQADSKRANYSVEPEVLMVVKEEPVLGGEELTSNEYYQLEPEDLRSEPEVRCSCGPGEKGEASCVSSCDNRARRFECSTQCSAGDQCTNRALQTRGSTSPPLTFSAGSLVVSEHLEPGDLVAQYTGQVMTRDTFQSRLEEYAQHEDLSLHVYPLSDDLVVDATTKGSICRFADHSCSPTAEISAWTVEGLQCLAVTARRQMVVGDILTLDLSPAVKFLDTSKRCDCDSRNCKKLLGRSAMSRGPEKCGACQSCLVEGGKVGEVLLHPQLATPLCQPCSDLSQQQDWREPGVMCRWCCQQSRLLLCGSCSSAFCRKCLQLNLGANYIKLAETGSWTCLLCDSRPLLAIKEPLWLQGEEERPRPRTSAERGGRISGRARAPALWSPLVRSPMVRSPMVRSQLPRAGTPGVSPMVRSPAVRGVRGVRPGTPRALRPRLRPGTPGTGGPRGSPVPVRMLGQTNVSIQRVARPQTRPQTSSIISQLQRYSGLSIQPVSQSTSSLEAACSQLEAVQRSIQATTSQSRKLMTTNLPEARKQLVETIKSCRAKMSEIESLL